MMIRNLQKPSDYSKAVMTQDELLRIAIANDANIAQARAGYQRGEVQELTPQQLKSPAELQADQALQERTALDNLLRLFQFREASAIIAELNPDEIFTMNQAFPEIERDINRRFAKGLLSPTFFVEYLRKFKEELEQSKGVSTNLSSITNKFNTLTDNINDIRAILPTREQFANIQDFLEEQFDRLPRMVVAPLLDRIQRLQNAIPSNEEFRRVSADSKLLQFETLNMLQNITADMPTQAQIERILIDLDEGRISQVDAFQRVQDAISGVSDAQLDALDELKRQLAESSSSIKGGENIEIIAQVVVGVPKVARLVVARKVKVSGELGQQNIYIVSELGNQLVTLEELKALIRNNDSFRNWYADNIGGSANLRNLKDYIIENTLQIKSGISDATSRETFSTEKSGFGVDFGLKAKNGRIRTKKIGTGVKYEPEPTYRQFGKYVINIPQLKERDILNVKFPSLGRIPQFKPTPISDVMKEFILELLETGKVSNRIYDQIPIEERQLFEKIAQGAGILNTLKLKRTISNEDKEDNDRFTLLKGEYLAGNNSVALLKELRKLVVKFMSQGKISKHDGMNLLIELSV